jgi:hypothetical protein
VPALISLSGHIGVCLVIEIPDRVVRVQHRSAGGDTGESR